MNNPNYNFKRFWHPRESWINLSDGGFLSDPESEYSHINNPDVVPFESIMSTPCLVLLGEPGIGKTYAMQTERPAIDSKIKTEGGDTLWLDLSSFGSEDRLVHRLFENETFISWANGKHQLHIFLDSLDECQLRIDNIAALLIDEIKKYPTERLFLRIACRTADWPNSLEDGIKQLWEEGSVLVYELAPLRRKDISEAAEANKFDSVEFLREIDRKEIVPLAIKPITLKFLINNYIKTHQFPSTQTELYHQGCRLLCEETSQSRRDAKRTGALNAEQRMAVAARIAVITVFANRYAIWTSFDQGNVPEEDVRIQDLCGENESINDDEFLVNDEAVSETLATGLFVSSGPNRLTWAHRTYAEFLASYYLVQIKATLTQILDLMIYPDDPDKKIIPQLTGVAAWLAGMVPDVFRAIIESNPEILLRSDITTIGINDKAKLTESLFNLCSKGKLQYYHLEIYKLLRKLAHPGLAEQIQPYLLDNSKNVVVRELAIDIVEACKLHELLVDLLNISLNPLQPIKIRASAASALKNSNDKEIKAKLKPLATNEVEEDTDDQLKGYSLSAIWPNHITAEELFKYITPPKRENLIGSYSGFLFYDLVQNLHPIDIYIALRWVEEQGPRTKLKHSFEVLTDNIMHKAWEHLESPYVLENFAKIVLSRLKNHEEIVDKQTNPSFSSSFIADYQKRREIVKFIVPMINGSEKDSNYLVFNKTPLILNEDLSWLIECFQVEEIKENQLVWAHLILKSFDWSKYEQVSAICTACSSSPILKEKFQHLLEPIKLDSPEAQEMRNKDLERKKDLETVQNRPLLTPPPSERITKLLDDFQSGELNAWWHLNMEMTLEPNSTHYGDELESDLTKLYGWKSADTPTREKIIDAAKIYLDEYDPQIHEWLGTNTIHRSVFAGYRAVLLLLKEDSDYIFTIQDSVWEKWSPIILAYPTWDNNELVELAYNHAPNEIIQTLMILIDKENEEHNNIFVIQKVKHCWDEQLAAALLIKVRDTALKPDSMGSLLSVLLENKVSKAKDFAESLVSLGSLVNENEKSRAIVAAKLLLEHAEDGGWKVVWSAMQKDTDFGKEVISKVANGLGKFTNNIEYRLTEEQLADLYIWISRQYPHAEDPRNDDAHIVESREEIAHLRDSILNHLKNLGTHKSCEAISRISSELPDLNWLKWTLIEAQNITRRNTWEPPQPRDILKLKTVINQHMHNSNKIDSENMKPTIGIITALTKEYAAVKILLENKNDKYKIPGPGAGRTYCLGEIPSEEGNKHNLVLATAGMGNNSAATRASLLLEHFPNVTSIIMVGIAGGVPNPSKDKIDDHVRLGDIVVSNENGVIQYDLIKQEIQEITYRNPPRPPSASLIEAVRYLEAEEIIGNRPWEKYITKSLSQLSICRPPDNKDILYSSENQYETITHPEDPKRIKGQPRVFIGPIASANILQKDPKARDKLREKFGVKAVEMEASGIADATWNHEVGYLVVRGICDYCDSHKNDDWQLYAAVVAAAYTRALIESMP